MYVKLTTLHFYLAAIVKTFFATIERVNLEMEFTILERFKSQTLRYTLYMPYIDD